LPDGEQDLEAMAAMCWETATRLRAAGGDQAAIAAAVERFLDFGDAGEYSPKELWGFFANTPPTVVALAGLDAEAGDRAVEVFALCTHARYGGGRPPPANWPRRK
jgi:hypothetical protein